MYLFNEKIEMSFKERYYSFCWDNDNLVRYERVKLTFKVNFYYEKKEKHDFKNLLELLWFVV